jgi:hypothetical protein
LSAFIKVKCPFQGISFSLAEREGLPAVILGRGSQEKMKIRYRSFIFLLLQRHQAKLERFHKSKMPLSGHFIFSCGERGL